MSVVAMMTEKKPAKAKSEKPTTTIRVYPDLAESITELAQLKKKSVADLLEDMLTARIREDLLGSPPTVTVEAKDAKGRRREPVPLPAHLAGVLRPWLATKAPNAPVWPGRWAAQRKQVHWFARDLARAGVAVFDARGQRATFHGLRRSFVVRLIRAGGLIHEVRRMARHKDVATTLNYYTDTDLDSLGKLADKTPPLPD